MLPAELAVDTVTGSALRLECGAVIDVDRRLPDFVFRQRFVKYFVAEYSAVYRREFGSFLSQLAAIYGDNRVNYLMVDPKLKVPFGATAACSGLASFDPIHLEERYIPIMYRDGATPGVLVIADIGAFWGSSLGWAIYCDRISWEIAVIAVSKEIDVPKVGAFRCLTAAQLSSYVGSAYSWKPGVAEDFNRRFFANYQL